MKVGINNGNAKINYNQLGFEILIPSKKNIFIILFFMAWLGGWLVGEVTVLGVLLTGSIVPFMLFWLIGWTVGGLFAILILSWMLFGKEVIIADSECLIIEKRILVFKKRKEYDFNHIKGYSLNEQTTSLFSRRNGLEYYGITGGKIKFDYGMKTVEFAINIDLAEARYLIDDIISKHRY